MINRKRSKVLGSVLGVMLTISVVEIPVLANDNLQATSVSVDGESMVTKNYEDYLINVNKSGEQNGIKVTLDKVVATKHKLKVIVKMESKQPFKEEKINDIFIKATFGGVNFKHSNMSFYYPDNKTILITAEEINDGKQDYPEKGELKVNVASRNCKIDIEINTIVEFSESFKNIIEKDMSLTIPDLNLKLNKFETDILGTSIDYSEPKKYYSTSETQMNYTKTLKIPMILKAGDKMYPMYSTDIFVARSAKFDEAVMKNYVSKVATYDILKDQKDIRIIPIACDISSDEAGKITENIRNSEKDQANKAIIKNVTYMKFFDFSDGTKGEIYNIERNDKSIKVYCMGISEKESLLMASTMSMGYMNFDEEYDNEKNMSLHKDPKNTLGYVVEFENVKKDKEVTINQYARIEEINRFKIGSEIQVFK